MEFTTAASVTPAPPTNSSFSQYWIAIDGYVHIFKINTDLFGEMDFEEFYSKNLQHLLDDLQLKHCEWGLLENITHYKISSVDDYAPAPAPADVTAAVTVADAPAADTVPVAAAVVDTPSVLHKTEENERFECDDCGQDWYKLICGACRGRCSKTLCENCAYSPDKDEDDQFESFGVSIAKNHMHNNLKVLFGTSRDKNGYYFFCNSCVIDAVTIGAVKNVGEYLVPKATLAQLEEANPDIFARIAATEQQLKEEPVSYFESTSK